MKTPNKSLRQKQSGLILFSALVAILFFFSSRNSRAQSVPTPPPAEILQSGDLIWPKKPGAIIPYNSRPGAANRSDAENWQREKDAYVAQLQGKTNLSREEKDRLTALRKMTYEEFVATYLGVNSRGEELILGKAGVSVGHVGIIEIVNGRCDVVEAMVKPGVRRISYAKWLEERPGELIWVGRLKGVSAEKRSAVAISAVGQRACYRMNPIASEISPMLTSRFATPLHTITVSLCTSPERLSSLAADLRRSDLRPRIVECGPSTISGVVRV